MWQLMEARALWLLVLPFAVALFFFLKRRRQKGLIRFSAPDLSQKYSRRTKNIFRFLFFLTLLAFLSLVFAISRPVHLKTQVKRWSEGIDMVIVLDVSESMDADDLVPTRLIAAKNVIREFISHRIEDRIGLVIFGGEAVMKSPLTHDHDFLLQQVDEIKLRELKQGTAIGSGLANGISRLRKSESKNKVIVLLTDGDSNVGNVNPITAAHLARQEGIRIYTVGIGRADRVVIPIYAYDSQGRKLQPIAKVPSYLNPELLRRIARITDGKAYMARDTGMLNKILQDISTLEKTKIVFSPLSEKEELFFWPAVLATLLFTLLFLFQETRYQRRKQIIPNSRDPQPNNAGQSLRLADRRGYASPA
jgi:Ca-activated chloride channel family protein